MVSLGYRSFWERPESRSRRDSFGDDESSHLHGVAVRVPDGGAAGSTAAVPPQPVVLDDNNKDKKNGGGKNKNKSQAASTCTSPSSSPEPTTTQEPTQSPTSQPVVEATTSPTVVPSTSSSTSLAPTTLTTATTAATTIWVTTSEWSTITSVQTATEVSALAETAISSSSSALPTGLFRGQSEDDCCHDKHHGPPPPNNNKFAIAFGTIGGLGFVVGFLWLAFIFYRGRRRRDHDTLSHADYASSTGKPRRFPFAWPFSRAKHQSEDDQRHLNKPPGGPRYSNASIMNEAMRGAYGSDTSSLHSVPHGYLDEKRQDPSYPLPVLDAAPVQQASLRKSLASWFRRSKSNHPLKLNPNSRWSRSTAQSSSTRGLSRTTTTQSDTSYSVSIYSASAGQAPSPPMPELDFQQHTYAAAAAGPVELPAPVPAYLSRDADEPSPFISPITTSRWSRSTISGGGGGGGGLGGGHERMSSVSSRTDATQTTISGGRESVPAVPQGTGLSPPGFHRAGGGWKEHETVAEMEVAEKEAAELTSLREELLELYTQGARPASAVGVKK